MNWLLLSLTVVAAVYVALIAALVIGSRQWDVRMIAKLVPYCAILFKRLLEDPRVPRRWKLWSAFALVYLAVPFDLVPDFIPVLVSWTTPSWWPGAARPAQECRPAADARALAWNGRLLFRLSALPLRSGAWR